MRLLITLFCLSVIGLLLLSSTARNEDKFTFDTEPVNKANTTVVPEEYGLWLK